MPDEAGMPPVVSEAATNAQTPSSLLAPTPHKKPLDRGRVQSCLRGIPGYVPPSGVSHRPGPVEMRSLSVPLRAAESAEYH